jgi:hypothetical protein
MPPTEQVVAGQLRAAAPVRPLIRGRRSAASDSGDDASQCVTQAFVLPDPDDNPPSGFQRRSLATIPLARPGYLRLPELSIRRRRLSVCGAPVPEATVYEDGHASTREDDVRAHARASDHHAEVLSESQAGAV